MKFILAPLMAIATFTGLVAAAAPDNEKTIDYSKYGLGGPVTDIYAYWPDKKDTDPDSRVIELHNPASDRTFPYRLHYKDPKDNKYDLSVAEDAEDSLAAADEDATVISQMTGAEHAAMDLDSKVAFSVYLDKDDKIVYMAEGTTVPTSYKDMLVHQEAYLRHLYRKLDPNTPGIEDLKDPGSIVAQHVLNELALQGPDALEKAKNDPNIVKMLDGLYDSADEFLEKKTELEAKVAQEDMQQGQGK